MCECIAKYTLFFFNLVFVLAGLGFVGLGIAVLVQLGDIFNLIPAIETIPIIAIVGGCIVFLIAFSGCCGAIRENRCLLITYAVCMLVLAGLKIWLAVVIFNYVNNLKYTIHGWIETAFQEHGQTPDGGFRALERIFRCCGTVGEQSYWGLSFTPPTCCENPLDTIGCANADTFFSGCNEIFSDYLINSRDIVGGIVIGIICIELIAMLFALFLNHRITNAKRAKHNVY